jgi:hypothetical protein
VKITEARTKSEMQIGEMRIGEPKKNEWKKSESNKPEVRKKHEVSKKPEPVTEPSIWKQRHWIINEAIINDSLDH